MSHDVHVAQAGEFVFSDRLAATEKSAHDPDFSQDGDTPRIPLHDWRITTTTSLG